MKPRLDMKPLLVFFLSVALLLSLTLFCSLALAELTPDLCSKTSQDALTSCAAAVQSNFWLAVAICDNLPTLERRIACNNRAIKTQLSETRLCNDQFNARQNVCRALGRDAYNPIINPANFVTTIDNPFFPLTPGTTFIYEGTTEDGFEHDEVFVTHNTKVILGVTCVEVRDTVTVDGALAEQTLDWYAQDKAGNVWYFGENSLEYADGLVVGLGGSWTAGVDGAKPGIIMKAHPKVGDEYRQEFSIGNAEDMAKVMSLAQSVSVPYGNFTNCLMTKEFSPLEPGTVERKFYAPGVGSVKEVDIETGDHLDLISVSTE